MMTIQKKNNIGHSLLILIISVVVLSACDMLQIEPKDTYSPTNFYKDADAAESAVIAIYSATQLNGGGRWAQNLLGIQSDNMYSPPYVPFDIKHAMDEYYYGPDNREWDKFWRTVYNAINRANVAINNIPNIEVDPNFKKRLIGEAKFLRGWQYFLLTKNMGNVPLILNGNLDSLQVEKESASSIEIYDQIINDLQAAQEILPESWSGEDAGRATSGSATSFLASVYLNLASIQANNIYPDRSYNENAETYYRMAAEKAKQVIDSGNYGLFDDYKDNFRLETENGKEQIYSYQHGRTQNVSFLNFFSLPYQCNLTQATGEGEFIPTLDIYKAYKNGDYRRDVNFITECTTADGEHLTWEDWSAPVPHIGKYFDYNHSALDLRGLAVPLMRYAEILLIYAESLNETGRTGEAYKYINMVRNRARNGNPSAPPQDIPKGSLSQDEFRDAIFRERRLEFPFEGGQRKDDLDRSGRLVETLCKPNAQALFVHGCENVQDYHVLFAKPARELTLNPLLKQNPGF